MNRRQFLTGVSAIAVSAALPTASAYPIIGIDLASGPDRAAYWIIELTPGGFNMWRRLWETSQMVDGVFPEYEATFEYVLPKSA